MSDILVEYMVTASVMVMLSTVSISIHSVW